MSNPYQQQTQNKPKKFANCLWFFHSADWKREEILDHSFSLINVNDYVNNSTIMRIKYLWIFFVVFRIIMVYLFDIYLLIQSRETIDGKENDKYKINSTDKCKELLNFSYNEKNVKFFSVMCDWGGKNEFFKTLIDYMFWLLLSSIFVGTVLGYLELKKAQKIIKSQDISFAYTNLVAYRYYCIKSYAYYCFFQLIQDHKKTSDSIAFFVFFTFKGWKRFIFADTLRRILNLVIFLDRLTYLYTKEFQWSGNEDHWLKVITSGFILFSWLMTGIKLLIAFFIYIPLLSVIQGNLKEYCCHKIDKRIGEIINSKTQQKIKRIQKMEKAKIQAAKKLGVNPNQLHLDGSALKKGYGIEVLPDPTLPQIDVDLNDIGTNNNNFPPNNYYNTPYNNGQYGSQYNGSQYAGSNIGAPPRTQFQGSVAYSDYSDSLNRPPYEGSSDSGSHNGSLPYNARNGHSHAQQPQSQYMNSSNNNHRGPANGSHTENQQWNSGSNLPIPPRAPGWNDQMSNASSNFSNGSLPAYRRNNGRPSFDTRQPHSGRK